LAEIKKHEREVNGRVWAAASRAYFAFIGAPNARTILDFSVNVSSRCSVKTRLVKVARDEVTHG